MKKGTKHSKETIALFHTQRLGNKNCVGRKLTDGHKEHMRQVNLGENNHNYGKPMSEEQRKKISEAHKKRVRNGTHHLWKGGVSKINDRIRQSVEYKLWRESVFKRDDYRCIWCGIRSAKGLGRITIEADHIKPFSLYPELRFAIDNGRTLCAPCHRKTKSFGKNL